MWWGKPSIWQGVLQGVVDPVCTERGVSALSYIVTRVGLWKGGVVVRYVARSYILLSTVLQSRLDSAVLWTIALHCDGSVLLCLSYLP